MLDEHTKFTFFHFLHNSRSPLSLKTVKHKLKDPACSKFNKSQLIDACWSEQCCQPNYKTRNSKYKAIHLSDHWSIHEAINWLETYKQSVSNVCILSGSQAALLDSPHITSRSVLTCHISLEEIATQMNICLCWVPGYRDIPENCKACQGGYYYRTSIPTQWLEHTHSNT